jgi:hypothetical protein
MVDSSWIIAGRIAVSYESGDFPMNYESSTTGLPMNYEPLSIS